MRGVHGQWGVNVGFRGFEGSEDIVKGIFDVVSEDLPQIRKMKWDVAVNNNLPTSQGFGMSAALAIAVSRAIQRAVGEEYELSLRRSLLHAHIAERLSSSGLGDVTGISAGGVKLGPRRVRHFTEMDSKRPRCRIGLVPGHGNDPSVAKRKGTSY